MNRKPRVFLSRTTKGLATLADKVAAVLDDLGFEVIHQPDFTMSWRKIRHMLMEKLRESDAVLCLVGPAYGFAPKTPIPEFRDPDTGRETFSYTQIEYLIAHRLHRPVFTILVQDDCATFPLDPFTQDDTERDLQRAFIRDAIKKDEHPSYGFTTHDELLGALRDTILPRDLSALPPSYPENIPYTSIGKVFTGRDETLRQLRDSLVSAGSTGPAVQVLHGTGGVGKTRVTVEYAHLHKSDYTARLFVNGSSPGSLDGALANLAGMFLLNLEEQDEKENEVRISAVFRWLALHPGWLLVIDNVDSKEGRDHTLHIVSKLPPGHVLITTRIHTWPGDLLRTPIDVLSDPNARDLLLAYRSSPKTEAIDTDDADALALARDLDGLALAIEQAAAFLNSISITIAEYHQRWKTNADRVRAWHNPATMNYPVSVATTWLTSFEQLTSASQVLLNLLAWLAPDPIPRFLIRPLAERKLEPDPLNGTDPAKSLGELTDFSLAKPDRKGVAFFVHRLIQEVVREMQNTLSPPPALQTTLDWLYSLYGANTSDIRFWPILRPLTPHVVHCGSLGYDHGLTLPTCHLLSQAGSMLKATGDYARAEAIGRLALELAEKAYDKNDPNLGAALTLYSNVLVEINRPQEAEPLMLQALEIAESHDGGGLPILPTALINLAELYREGQRLGEAEELLRRAISLLDATRFDDHPTLASAMGNLGILLQSTNHIHEAVDLFRSALALEEKRVDIPSPNAARCLSNLGQALHELGRNAEAESALRQAFDMLETFFGPTHPATAAAKVNLAHFLHGTNRLSEAESLLRSALPTFENLLGTQHPRYSACLGNLGQILQETNCTDEAEAVMRQCLDIDLVNYGPSDPRVALSTNNLGLLLKKRGNLAEAEVLLRRSLEIFEVALGRKHPRTAMASGNLGECLRSKGSFDKAEPYLRQALETEIENRGLNHPIVALALNNLAILFLSTNRSKEAEQHLARALDILLRFFDDCGQRHPQFLTLLTTYVGILTSAHRPLDAEIMIRKILTIEERKLGKTHPNLAVLITNLIKLHQSQHEFDKVEPLIEQLIKIETSLSGGDHPNVAVLFNNQAALLGILGRLSEAEVAMRKGVEVLLKFSSEKGESHPELYGFLNNYAVLRTRMGETELEAVAQLQLIMAPHGISLGKSG